MLHQFKSKSLSFNPHDPFEDKAGNEVHRFVIVVQVMFLTVNARGNRQKYTRFRYLEISPGQKGRNFSL